MSEQLKCDRCGRTYTDEESIEYARKAKDNWEASCRKDGDEPRGIYPCPDITCTGELTVI